MLATYVLAFIGGLVVMALAHQMIAEVVRAVRQGHRIAATYARCQGRRDVGFRRWMACARGDFLSCYSELHVGVWVLPHDPRMTIRRKYYL